MTCPFRGVGLILVALALLGIIIQIIGFLGMPVIVKNWKERSFLKPFVMIAQPMRSASQHRVPETVSLLDSEPLFLPTEYNAYYVWDGQYAAEMLRLPDNYRIEPQMEGPQVNLGQGEGIFEPKVFDGRAADFSFFALNERIDVISLFSSFNQAARSIKPLQERIAHVQVWDIMSNQMLRKEDVQVGDLSLDSRIDWKSLEYNVIIEGNGQHYHPLLTKSSGNQILDEVFAKYLRTHRRITDGLKPGYYQVRIGQ